MFEASNQLRLAGEWHIQNFQSNATVQFAIARSVNDSHASVSNLGFQVVARTAEIR